MLARIRRAARGLYTHLVHHFSSSAYDATNPRRKPLQDQPRPAQVSGITASYSLGELRRWSRSLFRNNPKARAAVHGFVASIVGRGGVTLKPSTGDISYDDACQRIWSEWTRDCVATGGRDLLWLQRTAAYEWGQVGEHVWRIVPDDHGCPRVLPLESEWISPQPMSVGDLGAGTEWVEGIKVDALMRPVAYWLGNPDALGMHYEEVSARDVIHGFEHTRPIQLRGEPLLAPLIEIMNQDHDIITAELQAAKVTGAIAVVIKSAAHPYATGSEDRQGDPVMDFPLGSVARLEPGEDASSFSNTRPIQQIGEFRSTLNGDISACMRVARRYLDRDISQANYSSMRQDILDERELIGPVQLEFGHATVGALYRRVMPILLAREGLPVRRLGYDLIPDERPYVDPTKDVEADMAEIAYGFADYETVLARRGRDPSAMRARIERMHADPLWSALIDAYRGRGEENADA